MKYPEALFTSSETDGVAFVPGALVAEARNFLEQLPGLLEGQIGLVNELNVSEECDEILDQLYRRNHIFVGLSEIHGLQKIARLLRILDFAFDLSRHRHTLKVHSIDYLITLFYDKTTELTEELLHSGKIETNISELLEESWTYLYEPLLEWNRRLEDTKHAFHDLPPQAQPPSTGIKTAPIGSAATSVAPVAGLLPTASAPPVTAIEIPFNDEPEPLNVPLEKLGMISAFYEENTEILDHFANHLLDLENASDVPAVVNDLFRMIHTVKGGARLLTIQKMECLAHTMENLLDLIRQGRMTVTPEIIDLLIECKNTLSEMMEEVASRGPFITRIRPFVERLQNVIASGNGASAPSSPSESTAPAAPAVLSKTDGPSVPPPVSNKLAAAAPATKGDKGTAATESLRVSSEKLDEVLNTASEIFIGRIRFQNEISSIQNFLKSFKPILDRASDFEKSRILAKLEVYIPEFSKELKRVIDGNRQHGRMLENQISPLLSSMVTRLLPDNSGIEMSLQEELNLNYLTIEEIQKQLQKNLETLEQLSTRLQNGAMSFRMVPISNLFERFPLQLRDLARTVGKKVRVEIVGGDTELDKVLINRLADPLLHMLRNSIDHGIEAPEERVRLGKPEAGTITLRTSYHGSYAVIEIRDDGRGLNVERILAKATEKRLIPQARAGKLSLSEIMALVFLPGFSTNEQVTELSGRGVGMDVVKTAINQLHGTIEIESKAGEGTCFKLKLPLTLAIVKILLVQESSYQFALPILNIEALITVQRADIKKVDNRLIYNYQGQTIPIASLSAILDFPQSYFQNSKIQMVVLNENNRLTGILVDSVLGRQEILIKNLGRFLKKAPFVMGCTILRDSRLVLILDPRQISDAVKKTFALKLNTSREVQTNGTPGQAILIVDDSAIQRENLKSILKSTDYQVETAENGFDALKACRKKNYAAFCVDIFMPLMDGYEFVERVRRIPIYEDVPVFFITSKTVDHSRANYLKVSQVFQKPVNGEELISVLSQKLTEKVEV